MLSYFGGKVKLGKKSPKPWNRLLSARYAKAHAKAIAKALAGAHARFTGNLSLAWEEHSLQMCRDFHLMSL